MRCILLSLCLSSSPLHTGTYSAVFRARAHKCDTRNVALVAVKVPHAESMSSEMESEAKTLRRISSKASAFVGKVRGVD